MTKKPKLSIGLVGSGFMGKAHVFGFATAQKVFDLPMQIDLHTVADIADNVARHIRAQQSLQNLLKCFSFEKPHQTIIPEDEGTAS